MSVTSIREGYTSVEAGGTAELRTATRVFTVTTSSPADRGLFTWPISAGGVTIPAPGTEHPDDEAYSSGLPAVAKRGPAYFDVRVPYEAAADPLGEPADISWSSSERQVAYDMDLQDPPVAVVNSMGEPFDPPLTRVVGDPVLTIERNQAAYEPEDQLTYGDSVSSEPFWGAHAGRARLLTMQARTVNPGYGRSLYWRVRYEIAFRMRTPPDLPPAKSWWRAVLNQGYRFKRLVGGEAKEMQPDGILHVLRVSDSVEDRTLPEAEQGDVWLYFQECAEENWAALGLEA